MKAVKLQFKTLVRSGEAGLGLESVSKVIHSDTLFGAIANALRALNEDVEEFIESISAGELRISSCFPFSGDTFYLPTPVMPVERKIGEFVSLEKFEKLIFGEKLEVDEETGFFEKHEVPKVSLDRVTANSNIYYLSSLKFKKGSGMYFIVDGDLRKIDIALRYLSDEGIGGKRTWGLGKFEYNNKSKCDFRIKAKGELFVTLSLTYPTDLKSIKYWKPVVRSGWINSPKGSYRKPKIIMASEGSVFKEEEQGKLLDLDEVANANFHSKLGHRVFVNGKSFLIPAVISYED
ncbi:MAG: CRISPR-associated protein Csm4 [Archaeoglobi archaeon]|nr:CRISPR-associated protein Csm4 [Archaeoglobi archaeon]